MSKPKGSLGNLTASHFAEPRKPSKWGLFTGPRAGLETEPRAISKNRWLYSVIPIVPVAIVSKGCLFAAPHG